MELLRQNFATFLNGEIFPAKFSPGEIPPPPPCTGHPGKAWGRRPPTHALWGVQRGGPEASEPALFSSPFRWGMTGAPG